MAAEGHYEFPPEVWRHVCTLAGEPADTTRPPVEVLAAAMAAHPLGCDCVQCVAYEAAQSN